MEMPLLSNMPEADTDSAACTIISKNYLPYARVLAESLGRYHPNLPLFVLLTDRVDGYFDPRNEPFTLVTIDELDIPDLHRFSFQYTILELNTAAKPYFLDYLLEKYAVKKLVYFDPDILIVNKLSFLFELLERYSIVITPHLLSPIEEDGFRPNEMDILRAGAYNLGFIAVSNTATTREFLSWWQSRVYTKCIVAFEEGLFVDQKWIDLVPGLFEGVHVLRAPGYNIAYWNLNSRSLEVNESRVLVNGEEAFFFHFSGFDPEDLRPVSKYQNRFTIDKVGQERSLFRRYRDLLMAHGYEETKNWPYVFASFDNGAKIPDVARRMYLRLGNAASRFGNPFCTNGPQSFYGWLNENVAGRSTVAWIVTRFWHEVYKCRPDLQRAYPDLMGADRPGFVEWVRNSGIGEYHVDEQFVPGRLQSNGVNRIPKSGYLKQKYREWTRPLEPNVKRILKKAVGRNEKLFASIVGCHRRLKGYRDSPSISASRVNPDTGDASLFLSASAPPSAKPAAYPASAVHVPRPFGVNLAGYVASEKGVGEALRSQARNFEAVGIPYVLNDFEDSGSVNQDLTYTKFSADNPYAVNLVQVNADQVPFFHQVRGQEYFSGRYNIGYWNWELSVFPPEWVSSFDYFDEIWVASNFALDSVSRVSPIPVIRIPFSMPEDTAIKFVDRSYFNLPRGKFVFLYIFDFHSFLVRKNPTGLIEAFKKAFTDSDEAVLLLKCSHSSQADLKLLQDAIGDGDVRIIDRVMSRDDIRGLLHLSDCYVSLHRSEGFGLTLAEAMSMGKPVIATGYSGNVDFMTAANSFPVKYSLTEIDSNYGPYKKGCIWAEPDTSHAADLMRFVFENQDKAREVGSRAQQDISSLLHPKAVGEMIKARLLNVCSLSRPEIAAEKYSDLEMKNDQNLDVDQIVARIRDASQWRRTVNPEHSAVSDAWQQPGFPDSQELLRQIGSGAATATVINEIPIRSKGWKRGTEARVKRFLKHLVHWNTKAQADFNQSTVRSLNLVAQSLQSVQSRISMLEHQAQSKESRVSEVEDSTRDLQQQVSRAIEHLSQPPEGSKAQTAAIETLSKDSFDYLAFEEKFRGNRNLIKQRQAVYLEFFENRKKVVDLGCGRGEFVELLYQKGIDGVGVDINEDLIQFCRSQGLRVVHADLFEYLASLTDVSIDGITAFQVVEHLPFQQLPKLLDVSRNKLKPGGVFIAETVNIFCPMALSHFYVDPSHIRPLPADLLRFLCEQAGFEVYLLRFSSPASGINTTERLDVVTADFPQEVSLYSDYSVVAIKPVP